MKNTGSFQSLKNDAAHRKEDIVMSDINSLIVQVRATNLSKKEKDRLIKQILKEGPEFNILEAIKELNREKQRSEKRIDAIALVALLGFFLFFFGFIKFPKSSPPEPVQQTTEVKPVKPEPPKVQYVTKDGTLERSLEAAVIEVMGPKTNWKTNRIISVSTIEQVNYKGIAGDVRMRINEGFSGNQTGKFFVMDLNRLIPKLLDNRKLYMIQEFRFFGSLVLVDQLGNEKEVPVTKAVISRERAKRVNWKNILYENIPVAFSEGDNVLWFHPAIRPKW